MPAHLDQQPLTYAPVGLTRGITPVPEGMHASGTSRIVGGPEVFERACDFVLGLGMQRAVGARVQAPDRPLEVGDTVVMTLGVRGRGLRIPTRVVHVVRETDRRGFAYGTLPGHPERGEELFLVERLASGETRVSVSAVSAPGRWFTRLAGPLGRGVQRAASWRYVDSVRRHCRAG
ncbi:DUF1990 family protein [Allobranchiibius huperziae]|uniref:Uncharacterized protein (UPF0548 family) n=1 Tax=Allobranchiibius huperziae TaxID=1874116 RepID=A0A853DEC2_9MICO|nr:uncharacterized protein (UPF0548 family) [Allobranchiibius huperziae]